MTSKLRIENIADEAQKITDSIIKHFTKGVKGNGYFYKDKEWDINKIITNHLKEIKLTDAPEDEFVILLPGYTMAARPGATARMSPSPTGKNWVRIAWDKENPYCGSQQDGNYYRESFKVIDRATYDNVRKNIAAVAELIKNVS